MAQFKSPTDIGDGDCGNHSNQQHPVLDVNAENVEPLGKHVQGPPRCRASRLTDRELRAPVATYLIAKWQPISIILALSQTWKITSRENPTERSTAPHEGVGCAGPCAPKHAVHWGDIV